MIAICPNPFRDLDLKITKQAQMILAMEGFETVICPVFADDEPDVIPADVETKPLRDCADSCSLAVVIGGDGTMLSVVRTLQDRAVPLLGINLGTKGFMAALEPEDVPLIIRAAKGDMSISRRMMLEVSLERNGVTICNDHALNDVVLHGYGECIQLTAWCDGKAITSFSGDGIILSSPTGSTGYSMSAGGPIVEPDAAAIILSPICAHMLSAKSFVLDPERTILVQTQKLHGRRAYMSVDGQSVADLENGDQIRVRRSSHCTLMADLGLKSFFEIAYAKLT